MRSELNLASRPLLNTTPLVALLATLALAAVGLSAWNAALFLNTRAEARAVESQLGELERQERDLAERRVELTGRLQRTDLDELGRRVVAANTVLAEKSMSWTLLLERLQEVVPWQVRLEAIRTSVRPDGVSLTLMLKTKTPDYYWQFIQDLEAHPCFADAYPADQKLTDDGELDVTIQVEHDPWCGAENPNRTARGRALRGGRRG